MSNSPNLANTANTKRNTGPRASTISQLSKRKVTGNADAEVVPDSEEGGVRTSSNISLSYRSVGPTTASSGTGTPASASSGTPGTGTPAGTSSGAGTPGSSASGGNKRKAADANGDGEIYSNSLASLKRMCRDTLEMVNFLGGQQSTRQTKSSTAVERLERACIDMQLQSLELFKELSSKKREQANADCDRVDDLIDEYSGALKQSIDSTHKARETHGKNVVSMELDSDVDNWDSDAEASSVAEALIPSSDAPSSDA